MDLFGFEVDLLKKFYKKTQKKSQRREALAFKTHIFLWCPVRDSNPHARALGSKPNVSTNSTNWASIREQLD